MTYYVAKPINPDELVGELQKWGWRKRDSGTRVGICYRGRSDRQQGAG